MTATPAVELAERVAGCDRPLLIGLDIDGVLAPIVDHADDARLLEGMAEAIAELADHDDVVVAAVSGRAIDSVITFGFPPGVRLVGSHGLEEFGRPSEPLDAQERRRLDELVALAEQAARHAGTGAWVERKTASTVLHIREADDEAGLDALANLARAVSHVEGASVKAGSEVLELFTRHASKGTAIMRLRGETGAATTVYVGDDLTDEEAFAELTDGDVSIKVGTAATIAAHRLHDPGEVLRWLRALNTRLAH